MTEYKFLALIFHKQSLIDMQKIFKEGKKYTFNDYFKMNSPTTEIVTALGYSLLIQEISLPKHEDNPQALLKYISTTYYALIPKVSIDSEAAKREIMIAPVLHAVIQLIQATLNIEYPVYINDKLNGTIDYLFRSAQELIVVEAKKGDLERGFNQLAAEMIANELVTNKFNNRPLYDSK